MGRLRLTIDLPVIDTSMRLKVNHVYQCGPCQHLWLGYNLHKNQKGVRTCPQCDRPVEDVTFTPTGAEVIKHLGAEFAQNGEPMNLFKRDTLPKIGDYDFAWASQETVTITDRAGKTETYSVEALSRISNSQGFSMTDRNKACAALDWAADHLPRRSSREFTTTPGL